jgi:hypothetical protein
VLPSSEFISRVLIKFVSNNNRSFGGGLKTECLLSLYEKGVQRLSTPTHLLLRARLRVDDNFYC